MANYNNVFKVYFLIPYRIQNLSVSELRIIRNLVDLADLKTHYFSETFSDSEFSKSAQIIVEFKKILLCILLTFSFENFMLIKSFCV